MEADVHYFVEVDSKKLALMQMMIRTLTAFAANGNVALKADRFACCLVAVWNIKPHT